MANEKTIYRNFFDGYETSYHVYSSPDKMKECVIQFENTPSVDIIIPYESDLTPEYFRTTLQGLLARCDAIAEEEYPFRTVVSNDSQMYPIMGIYWHNGSSKVQVTTTASSMELSFDNGRRCHLKYLPLVKCNIQCLLHSMKY